MFGQASGDAFRTGYAFSLPFEFSPYEINQGDHISLTRRCQREVPITRTFASLFDKKWS